MHNSYLLSDIEPELLEENPVFILRMRHRKLPFEAKVIKRHGKYVLLKGSHVECLDPSASHCEFQELKAYLIKEQKLIPAAVGNNFYILTTDYDFPNIDQVNLFILNYTGQISQKWQTPQGLSLIEYE